MAAVETAGVSSLFTLSTRSPPRSEEEASSSFWSDGCKGEEKKEEKTASNKDNNSTVACCSRCRQDITDQFIFHVHPDMEFHATCLKMKSQWFDRRRDGMRDAGRRMPGEEIVCSQCNVFLDESCSAFVKNGTTYCRQDYERLFGAKCSRCSMSIRSDELVMRASQNVFHLHCFSCCSCHRRLVPGDEYVYTGGLLYCTPACSNARIRENASTPSMYADDEWEVCTKTSIDHGLSSPIFSSPVSEGVSTPPFSSPSAVPSTLPLPPASNQSMSLNHLGQPHSVKKHKKDKGNRQTTRVRTVLNENQLSILKRCYNQNSRPDAIIKEQLVEMTGLNSRVIRVWFQNKRCKDKKRQIQQRDSEVHAARERELRGIRMQGVGPLVTPSPSTFIDSNLPNPSDVIHFQQWPAGDGCPPPNQPPLEPFGVPPMHMSFEVPPEGLLHFHHPPPPFPSFSPHVLSDLSSPCMS